MDPFVHDSLNCPLSVSPFPEVFKYFREVPEDPFAEFSEILSEIMNFLETAQTGEEIDFAAFADTLKANHPDYADMIDLYLELYKTYGAEGFASMMNAAE